MLEKDSDIGEEDIHWLARARYHFRMEEYWRDRALSAEHELEQLKKVKSQEKRKSGISRCCP